jgi:hypothetical protein
MGCGPGDLHTSHEAHLQTLLHGRLRFRHVIYGEHTWTIVEDFHKESLVQSSAISKSAVGKNKNDTYWRLNLSYSISHIPKQSWPRARKILVLLITGIYR